MSDAASKHFRTPLARVRGRGAAKSGTEDFWVQRVTSVAGIPLTVAAIIIVLLLGHNQAAVAQILGAPVVAVIMLLFIVCTVVHMKIGGQEIVTDYAPESWKVALLLANTFYCWALGLVCAYAIVKMSFGV